MVKRDMDLVRDILFKLEDDSVTGWGPAIREAFPDLDTDVVFHHLTLLVDAGLIAKGAEIRLSNKTINLPTVRLTWAGHEFLEAARNESVWNQAKEKVGKAGSWTFGLLLKVLTKLAEKEMGLGAE